MYPSPRRSAGIPETVRKMISIWSVPLEAERPSNKHRQYQRHEAALRARTKSLSSRGHHRRTISMSPGGVVCCGDCPLLRVLRRRRRAARHPRDRITSIKSPKLHRKCDKVSKKAINKQYYQEKKSEPEWHHERSAQENCPSTVAPVRLGGISMSRTSRSLILTSRHSDRYLHLRRAHS